MARGEPKWQKQRMTFNPLAGYYGNKMALAPEIISRIPEHKCYVEPFCGAAAIFWRKIPSPIEVIGDKDGTITNFFCVLANQQEFEKFQQLVLESPRSELLFKHAYQIVEFPILKERYEVAWAFWYIVNTSFFGTAREMATRVDSAINFFDRKARIEAGISKRMSNVQILHGDAVSTIRKFNQEDTFFYCDPPYINTEMGRYEGYAESDYTKLLETLSEAKGKFILSSYENPFLTEAIMKYEWEQISITKRASAVMVSSKGSKNGTVEELLVSNFKPTIQTGIDG